MTTIITREVGATAKGSPLTNAELDANFVNLNTEVTPSRATVRPSLLLDFANTKQLDPRITFSRASTATYYDGKSVVKAEENLLTYSQDFGATAWAKTISIGTNSNVAPDGSATATLLQGDSGAYVTQSITTDLSIPKTCSVFLKAGSSSKADFYAYNLNGGNNCYIRVDLSTGTATAAGAYTPQNVSIINVGSGWYRCSFTTTFPSGTGMGLVVYNRYSSATTLYIWGMQIENRTYATAYTPTTSSAITNYIPVLQTAASGTARFDHDPVTGESKGLLIEEQRTNLVYASSQFNLTPWFLGNAGVATNVGIAPDGTNTATKLYEDTTNNAHYVSQISNGLTIGSTYTFSAFIKAADRTKANLLINLNTGYVAVGADLSAGTVITNTVGITQASTSSIVSVGNGWYRLSCQFSPTQTTATVLITTSNASSWAYAGDGKSGLYFWGAQLEAGSFATSYIPTQLTYTGRASTATYKAADGLIRIAGNDVARYEPNAAGGSNLLLEGAASNLLTYTGDFATPIANVGYGYAVGPNLSSLFTVMPFAKQAPDGSLTGVKFVSTSTTSQGLFLRALSPQNAGSYTASIYIYVPTQSGVTDWGIVLDAADNATDVATITGITKFDEWYKVSLPITYTASRTFLDFNIRYNGNGAPTTAGFTLYAWGAQLETGSVATSYIPSTETHTGRSSTATYYDSTGTIRTAASGQPRYTYNPSLLTAPPKLLLEPAATNLFVWSDAFEGGAWSKENVTINANAAIAPDGTTTADLMVETTATNTIHRLFQVPASTAGTYTHSAYLKYAGRQYVHMFIYNSTDGSIGSTIFDIQNGTKVSGGGTIVPVGNGWYRCATTANTTVSNSSALIYIFNNQSLIPYTGDGTSGIYVWGAQLESGYATTSYIPTFGSAVTRAADTSTSAAGSRAADVYSSSQVTRSADSASMTGTNFSSWFKQSEGTLYAQAAIIPGISSYPTVFQIGDSTLSNAYSLSSNMYYNARVGIRVNNSNVFDAYVGSTTEFQSGTPIKWSLSYKASDNAGVASGSNIVSSNAINPSTVLDRASIGSNVTNSLILNGWIKRLAYYPKRLTNAELQGITS